MNEENEMYDRAAAMVGAQTTMVLATASPDGSASAAPLYFYAEGLNLYWLSSPDSRHSRNISARPRVAVAVYACARDWRDIRGVQMEGEAVAVEDARERGRVIAAYRKRFVLGAEFDEAIAASTLYVFRPAWVRYVDNREAFGFKREFGITVAGYVTSKLSRPGG